MYAFFGLIRMARCSLGWGKEELLFLQKGTHTIRISTRLRHFAGSPFLKGEPFEKPRDPAGVSFNSVNCAAQEASESQ